MNILYHMLLSSLNGRMQRNVAKISYDEDILGIHYILCFFSKRFKYSGLWPFSVVPRRHSVYTHRAGRTQALQQNWQSSENSQYLKEKTQYLMNTLYKMLLMRCGGLSLQTYIKPISYLLYFPLTRVGISLRTISLPVSFQCPKSGVPFRSQLKY